MNFSISSANMTILISNIFIFLLFLIFRNQKVRFNLGLPILIGFIFLICFANCKCKLDTRTVKIS